MTEKKTIKRVSRGTVVSDKMDKTIVVRVDRAFKHPKLGKVVRTFKKFKVHDPENLASVGDLVEFVEGRPVSRTKERYLVGIVTHPTVETKE